MSDRWHSIKILKDLCLGCTHCLRNCPTEAIRVRNGAAEIYDVRCIDCGECIRICPYEANCIYSDSLSMIRKFNYKIIVIPESLSLVMSYIGCSYEDFINSLLLFGFDEVWEEGIGGEVYLLTLKEILKEKRDTLITTACPPVLRLIQMDFPSFIKNISPLNSPMDILAFYLRKRNKDAGIFYLSILSAKVTTVRNPIGIKDSPYDAVFGLREIFTNLNFDKGKAVKNFESRVFKSGRVGAELSIIGGESKFLKDFDVLSVDGIWNVKKVLEEMENGKLSDLKYLEARSCPKGCVGGLSFFNLNPYVAYFKIGKFLQERKSLFSEVVKNEYQKFLDDEILYLSEAIVPRPRYVLSKDVRTAVEMMRRIEEIYKILPKLDCGSCGAPSCRALAEDVVMGKAKISDCKFIKTEN